MSVNGEGTNGEPGDRQSKGTAPSGGHAPDQLPVVVIPHRPWVAPTIACLVAAIVLLFLLIPGVLRYPAALAPEPAAFTPAPGAQAATNRALEERIASLRRLLDARVCVAPDGYHLPDGPAAAAVQPQDRAALPAAPPDQTRVPPQSVPENRPFSGSLLDLLDQATVLVLQTDAAGKVQGSGTGFFVAPGRVLTNRHVTAGDAGRKIHVVSRATGVATAQILAESADGEPGSPDFALLGVPEGNGANLPVPLSFAPPAERLVNVITAGYPGMVLNTDGRFQQLLRGEQTELPTAAVTEGVVTAVQSGAGTGMVLHTAQITPGNSGGPLVDRCGRVLGINTFIQAREEGRMNYALAAADASRFLAANNVRVRAATGACIPPSGTPAPPPAAGAPATGTPGAGQPAAPKAE
ncbi:serine protease [Roseomonas genomospecies 6]|uniref:Serine protease n=1 Tax=Roseomonas genomospecies 6 TaxID=214106 RepID=A0A9W7KP10_9PROT|nr:serine protease [Roseomonas genomospecies 6]KAA0675698.1 serine protease [Roseomonas genomospecies 6]